MITIESVVNSHRCGLGQAGEMLIFATFSDMARLGGILDLDSGALEAVRVRSEFIHAHSVRPACRPFGITWSSDEVFISNHKQLLVYDCLFNYIRTSPVRLQINVHQLAFNRGRVWSVSPWTNSLIGVPVAAELEAVELDLINHALRPYLPRDGQSQDRWHFNSLLWTDRDLYVAAHALGGPSFIYRYSSESFHLLDVIDNAGRSIHGLAIHDGEVIWISTTTNEIRSSLGGRWHLTRPGYARGFAVTENYFIVGISEFLVRDERTGGDSWVQTIDRRTGSVLGELHLRGTGSINDLRLLDEYDYAHHIIPLYDGRANRMP